MQIPKLEHALGEANVVGWGDADTTNVVKSAGRTLRILELFDVLQREALVCEISDLLDLPQSSTSVLLRSLAEVGYLSYNRETRAYCPTARVALLGSWIGKQSFVKGELMRLLERISSRTGQTVLLAGRNRIWSQYLHVVQATHPVRLYLVKGSKRPLARSATGYMLLADLSDVEIKRLAIRYNAETPDGGDQVDIAALPELIQRAREAGYAYSDGLVTPNAGMIAMPLPLVGGERFVVGVGGVSTVVRNHFDEFLNVLREEISVYVQGLAGLPERSTAESVAIG